MPVWYDRAMSSLAIILLILVLGFVALAAVALQRVPEGCNLIVYRKGRFDRTLGPGWHLLIPGVERPMQKVAMGGRVLDVRYDALHTKDGQSVEVDGALYYQVLDAEKVVDHVDSLSSAALSLVQSTAQDLVSDMTSDSLARRRSNEINQWLLGMLNQASSQWGVRITRLDLRFDFPEPPEPITDTDESADTNNE